MIKGGLYKRDGSYGDRARSAMRRAVPDASGKLSSFSEGQRSIRFHELAGVSIVAAACPHPSVDTSTVESRVTTSSFNTTT